MKITITSLLAVLAVIGLASGAAQAGLLLNDNFDSYSTGNIVGQVGPNGTTWAAQSAAGTGPVQVVAGSSYGLSANALQLNQATGAEDVNEPIGSAMGAASTWYASFQVCVNGSTPVTTANYFAMFLQATSNFNGKVFITPGSNGADYNFGFSSSKTGATPSVLWSSTGASGFEYGTVQTVVVSYDSADGSGSIWIDPTGAGSTSVLDTFNSGFGDLATAFAFRQSILSGYNVTTETVDNLMVGTSFGDVAPVPEPATMSLLGLGLVGLVVRKRKNAR